MLIGLDIGFDELRRDQPDGMAQRLQLARSAMRAAAYFHANQARRQVGKECRQLASLESLFKGSFSMRIYPMDLEHVFCQIDANRRRLYGGRSFRISSC
jgi:hypothetical protein